MRFAAPCGNFCSHAFHVKKRNFPIGPRCHGSPFLRMDAGVLLFQIF